MRGRRTRALLAPWRTTLMRPRGSPTLLRVCLAVVRSACLMGSHPQVIETLLQGGSSPTEAALENLVRHAQKYEEFAPGAPTLSRRC